MKITVVGDVTLRSALDNYGRVYGTCEVNLSWWRRQYISLKYLEVSTRWRGAILHETVSCIIIAVITSNLTLLFSLLHRACCWVTQLLYQLLHIYKIYKIYTLKTLRHVSVLGPSSGSHIVLARVTIKSHINFAIPVGYCGSMPYCVMLCCEECPAADVHSVLRCVICAVVGIIIE